jgi:cell division ATPase FtsA
VTRIKEKVLNFNKIDRSDEIILALECYYDELINYVFTVFSRRFSGSKGSIEHPIEIVLSGGTAMPPGLDKRVEKIIDRMKLPFEVKQVRLAKDMLRSVATGCYLRAKQAAKKLAASSKLMDEVTGKDGQ